MTKRVAQFLTVLCIATMLPAFSCLDGETYAINGFVLHTFLEAAPSDFGFQLRVDDPDIQIQGSEIQDAVGAIGWITFFNVTTDDLAKRLIENGRSPARWNLTEYTGHCAGQTLGDAFVPRGDEFPMVCQRITLQFSVSPASVDGSVATLVTLSGSGISTANGTPEAWIVDNQDRFVQKVPAEWVSSDGTLMTFWLQSIYSGSYTIVIRSANADGTMDSVGLAFIDAYNNDPPPPPPDPGCVGNYCGIDQ